MNKIEIAPSILSADFGYLMDDVKSISSECSYLHLDVMDGHFVPNISLGIPVIKSLRKHSDLNFDTHLMLTDPGKYIDEFVDAGSDAITFHVECSDDPFGLIDRIRARNVKAGVAIHPDTPVEMIYPFLEKGAADQILVMSVRPGFGGQSYLAGATERISRIRGILDENGSDAVISVDGGINIRTIREAACAGARLIVAGSAVFKKEDKAQAVRELTEEALKGLS
ncbi:MAG TPA: ribulose-phosphate 3-epimerase [Clostridiales bacterium]|nr:ribulose-phosphate 3-epimerase [Clostridiales bacterium]